MAFFRNTLWLIDCNQQINIMEGEPDSTIRIRIAVAADVKYVYPILEGMERSARGRGTGIAPSTPQSLCQKIYEGKAVIALATKQSGAGGAAGGFSCFGNWADGRCGCC